MGIFPQPKSLETLENSYIDSGRQTAAVVVHPKRDAGTGKVPKLSPEFNTVIIHTYWATRIQLHLEQLL